MASCVLDSVAAVLFNPLGKAPVSTADTAALWAATKEGDKYAKWHSEYCATDEDGGEYKRGIAMSKFAEVMHEEFIHLESVDTAKYVQPNILTADLT